MYFQLSKLILWSKSRDAIRIVELSPGRVNVITGASKTGKSAVIPIVDYCLGARKCAIPVGVIRESCAWFGIVVHTLEGEKLFARKEPGTLKQSSDMYVLEGEKVEVPIRIDQHNSNTDTVKTILNRLAGLPQIGFFPDLDQSDRTRPSFRDLVAFTFQPQNIVANPDVLFFKADTTAHREKLKTIFPFVLNAVTTEVLAAQYELIQQERHLKRLEQELRSIESVVEDWRVEATGWLRQAVEYGLYSAETQLPENWEDILYSLRAITKSTSRSAKPTIQSIDATLTRLEELRVEEAKAASGLSEKRQRYHEIRRLRQSSESYGSAIKIQRERLMLSDWIKAKEKESNDVLVQLSTQGRQDIADLCRALEGVEVRVRSHPTMSDKLDKERIHLSQEVEQGVARLTQIRREISEFERESDAVQQHIYQSEQIDRFIGRLEQALALFDKAKTNSELKQNIQEIQNNIDQLNDTISERDIASRLKQTLSTIESHASSIIPNLDAEWPEAPIKFLIDDLTIQVIQGTRKDYLWEIGSAANWLCYHVAVTLSLQRYFLSEPNHPVPSVLVYDQPSQAYFPRQRKQSEYKDALDWNDEDVIAVKKIIKAIAKETGDAKGRLQVLILDHAGSDVWGNIDNVELVENWREGQKLVPEKWLFSTGKS